MEKAAVMNTTAMTIPNSEIACLFANFISPSSLSSALWAAEPRAGRARNNPERLHDK
jgi:hypothetical protein